MDILITLPLLTMLVVLPIIGGLITLLLPARLTTLIARVVGVLGLLISFSVLAVFDPGLGSFQLIDEALWMPGIQIYFRLGVDGISVLFLPATQILFCAVYFLEREDKPDAPLRSALLMLFHAATLGIFCALDGVLFFMFWELALLPTYFLVSRWGLGALRREAATQYILTMLLAGIPIMAAFLLLASQMPGGSSFDLRDWLAHPLSRPQQTVVFLLMLLGFGFKIPLFPLHNWLPVMANEGTAGVLAIVAGLKIGVFALLRLAIPLAPQAALDLHWLLAGLGTAGLLFGAAAALAQTNLRSMLAYSSLSHVSMVVLGIASFNLAGIQGSVFQLLNFSLISGGLFLMIGALHRRTGTNEVGQLGGAAKRMPWMASFVLLFGLAGMGIPGTSGFPAELTIFLAVFTKHAGAALAVLVGAAVAAAAFLSLYRQAFFGPAIAPAMNDVLDLDRPERSVALVFGVIIVFFGLFPQIIMDAINASTHLWVARLR